MRTAFSTLGCPDWSWQEILEYGPQWGYDGVEVRLIGRETDLLKLPELQPQRRAARLRELGTAGFAVCGLASSVRFDDPDAGAHSEQLQIGKAYVDLAAELEAGFVRVFGDVLPSKDDPQARGTAIGHIADGLQELGEYGQSSGVDIVIETHGDYSSSKIAAETLQRVTCPAVGVLWDTHHPWRFCGEQLAQTVERLRPWIRHTHWKDSITRSRIELDADAQQAADEAHQLMSGHQHADYVLFGGGEFPAFECAALLKQIGYDGWLCLEWEKMWHPEIEDPEVALPLFPGKIQAIWEFVG